MKIIITIFICFSTVAYVIAQDFKFPNGVYLNHEQFKNRTPAFNTELKTIIRSSTDIFLSGGNTYKFESETDSLDKDYIKKEIYAYVKNDSVFLNCKHHKLQSWYALAITYGNFVTFYSCVSTKKMILSSAAGGAIGGAVGGAIASSGGGFYDWHVLSLRTGNARELDKEYMKGRLAEHPDLLTEFEQEKQKNHIVVLLKYIEKLNAITDPNSEAPVKKK